LRNHLEAASLDKRGKATSVGAVRGLAVPMPWVLAVVVVLGGTGGFLAGALVPGGWLPRKADPRSSALVALIPAPDLKSASLVYEALFHETAEAVRPLVERHPDRAQTVAALALLNFLAHNVEGERTCWRKCLELDPTFAAAYTRLGRVATDRGEYAEAIRVMRDALAIYPHDVHFLHWLGSALLSGNQPQEAVRALEEHARAVPNSPQTFFLLGQAHAQLNQFDRAKSCYEKAIELYPEYTNAYHGLATACTRLGRPDEAKHWREVFQKLKVKDRELDVKAKDQMIDELVTPQVVAEILTFAGQAYLAGGDDEAARQYWLRSAVLAPKSTDCRAALRELHIARGELQEASRYAAELALLEPFKVEHHRSAAALYAQLGQAEPAEREFRVVCQLAPRQGWGYAGLAQLFMGHGRAPRETVVLARTAVRFEPSAQNYVILAGACERAGDPAGALAAIERAAALAPDNLQYQQLLQTVRRRKK
jgi:tetratricopeptide (TPR) repeat protein